MAKFRHFPKLIVIIALAAVALSAVLSAFFAWSTVTASLAYSTERAVLNAERMIDRSAADLQKLDGLRYAPCDALTVQRLKDAVYGAHTQIREIGLIRNGQLFCTNFGPTSADISNEQRQISPGTRIGVGPNVVVPNNTSLYVYAARDETFAVNAVINPLAFAEFERDFNYAAYSRLRMRVDTSAQSGAAVAQRGEDLYVLGRLDSEPAAGGFFTKSTSSTRFPLKADIAVPRKAFWEEFRNIAPPILAAHALVTTIGLLLLNAWLSKGGFETLRYSRALRDGELRVFYQPIVDAHSRKIVGLEALLRWQHPKGGLLRAAKFGDIFEDAAMAEPLNRFIFATAAADMRRLPAAHQSVWCSVNLSPVLLENHRLLDEISKQIRALPSNQLRLEMTERTPVSEQAEVTLRELRALGIKIGLDDLGTGYSNLNQLQRMTYDFIKIDGMLVRDIQSADTVSPVVTSLIALATKLGSTIVAEGIETHVQAQALTHHGVQLLQGFLFSPARPIDEIIAALVAQDS